MDHPLSSSGSFRYFYVTFLLVITVFITRGVLASAGRYPHDDYGDDGDQLLKMERFHAWMAAHGRLYPTVEEKFRRFHIYRDNMEFIEATNRDTSKSYKCGENEFSDLSHQEFLAMYTMASHSVPLNVSPPVITTLAGDVIEVGRCIPPKTPPPESIDWREHDAVTPVQDQGQGCNACWVFTGVATIESAHKIKMKNHGDLVKLSEQEIVDCTDNKCGGGNPKDVLKWVLLNGGIASESQYGPYNPNPPHECKTGKIRPAAARVRDIGFGEKNCESGLAVRVARQPVAVRFDAHERGFQFYSGGIYSWQADDNIYRLNHAMAVVGYGEDAASGQKYWIAKNSWGGGWGEGGYIFLHKDMPGGKPQGVGGMLASRPTYPII